MDTVTAGLAAIMVVRSDGVLHGRTYAAGAGSVSRGANLDVGTVKSAWERLGDSVFGCRLPFLDVTVEVVEGG